MSESESESASASESESEALALELVIHHGTPDPSILAEFKHKHREIRVLEYDTLLKLGRDTVGKGVDGDEDVRPGSDDVACVMYTSGSAGKPKGVLLSHGNVLSAGT